MELLDGETSQGILQRAYHSSKHDADKIPYDMPSLWLQCDQDNTDFRSPGQGTMASSAVGS